MLLLPVIAILLVVKVVTLSFSLQLLMLFEIFFLLIYWKVRDNSATGNTRQKYIKIVWAV
jgi:hypothetical protein